MALIRVNGSLESILPVHLFKKLLSILETRKTISLYWQKTLGKIQNQTFTPRTLPSPQMTFSILHYIQDTSGHPFRRFSFSNAALFLALLTFFRIFNTTWNSQKWTFNNRTLSPQTATTMCLDVNAVTFLPELRSCSSYPSWTSIDSPLSYLIFQHVFTSRCLAIDVTPETWACYKIVLSHLPPGASGPSSVY